MSELDSLDRRGYLPMVAGAHTVYVEAVGLDEEEEVAARLFELSDLAGPVGAVVSAVADTVTDALRKAKPSKVSVEFGCEIGMQTGKLTAVLVQGTAKANIKVVAEWITD